MFSFVPSPSLPSPSGNMVSLRHRYDDRFFVLPFPEIYLLLSTPRRSTVILALMLRIMVVTHLGDMTKLIQSSAGEEKH